MLYKKAILLSTVIFSFGTNLFCYGATPNDIREFIGMDTIDSKYSFEEREQIKKEYEEIERYNRLAQLIIDNNGDRTVLNAEIDKEATQLKEDIDVAIDDLYDAFYKESVSVVKEKSTALSNLESKLSDIREKADEIDANLKDNPYIEAYKDVIRVEDMLSKEKDIGSVGNALKTPLGVKFDIIEPFGTYTTKSNTVVQSNGIKLKGLESNNVMSLWGGTIKSIKQINGLYEVVVEHSTYMHTKYTNLRDLKVKEGDSVNQYTYLGKLGKLKDMDYVYLKLEVLMDGNNVDPMFFFGKRGVNALKEYTSKSGSKVNMDSYLNVKENFDEDEAIEKPIYNKQGDVEDGAIVPSVNGKVPNPSPSMLEDDLLDVEKNTINKK